MININKILLIITISLTALSGQMFQTVPIQKAKIIQQGKDKIYCPNCGMHLGKFYKTNHIHKANQYCSLHCLVENNQGKPPSNVKVVDTNSLKHIDAFKAFYIVGSKKKGTMSLNSKYAFEDKNEAIKFKRKFGGKMMSFEEAFDVAKKDFVQDINMIEKKRTKKVYKIGKKLYLKKCQKDMIDVNKFQKISMLKNHIKTEKLCKNIVQDKQLQAIAVYLWDIKKLGKSLQKADTIKVPKSAKCPVCGMFVAKYPKWAATVSDKGKNYYFDGVKDMMKFIFKTKKEYKNIKVTDYYTTNEIDAIKAYYVTGSTIYGPMGHELIPFSTREKAESFKDDHSGKKILRYSQIDKKVINEIDK